MPLFTEIHVHLYIHYVRTANHRLDCVFFLLTVKRIFHSIFLNYLELSSLRYQKKRILSLKSGVCSVFNDYRLIAGVALRLGA